jgi:hypothetical protein
MHYAGNVTTRQLQMVTPLHTSKRYMKERSSHAGNVTTKQLQMVVLLNVTIGQFQRVVISTSKGNLAQHQQASTHAGNVTTRQQKA